jgi:hypothetical protein
MPQTLWIIIAFIFVLVLIGAAAWLVRRFGSGGIGSNASRGRMPRLAVIDAAAVDGRRKLVLVRRDNVEHLLMIGGPTDVVVEPNIVRSTSQRDQAPQRGPVGTELPTPARLSPDVWPETELAPVEPLDHREPPVPELPPRPAPRSTFPDEPRRAAPPLADRHGSDRHAADRHTADPLANFAPEPMLRPEPPLRSEPPLRPDAPARVLPRSERNEPRMPRPSDVAPKAPPLPPLPPRPAPAAPRPADTPRATDVPLSSADQNLADMAKRLEQALRHPGTDLRSPSPEPRPSSPALDPTHSAAQRRAEPAPRAASPASAPPSSDATAFESLEDEMASLLGRPKPPA